jgi:hypothetical protein
MPEAAVNKNGDALLGEKEVGVSRAVSRVKPPTRDTGAYKGVSKSLLGRPIVSPTHRSHNA